MDAQAEVAPNPDMRSCATAPGPRPVNGVPSPGNSNGSPVFRDINGGFCGGVTFDTPGMWWKIQGTGGLVRASTCDSRTTIKTKIAVFTGSCDALRCVTGSSLADFECDALNRKATGEWDTRATAVDFQTFADQEYYILVNQIDQTAGTVWMNFQEITYPQNNDCVDAVGPLPRNLMEHFGTTANAAVSDVAEGYCGATDLYPGTWYQFMGTGKEVTLMACSEFNIDGFYFSVYNGGTCDSKSCVKGSYEANVKDEEKCTFGPAEILRPLTKYRVQTKDMERYYVYIHYARTAAARPTSDFRLFIDDGEGGTAGSGGFAAIKFEASSGSSSSNNGGGSNSGNNSSGALRSIENYIWASLAVVAGVVGLLF